MQPDDPNARPTRTFSGGVPDGAAPDTTVPPDLTRTFSGGEPVSPIDSGWPAGLARYRPLRLLATGMAPVYLAHDTQLDRPVAVKFAFRGAGSRAVERTLNEARAAARLHHPNVCPVFDADVCDGVPYLTMAYVDGPTLAEELKRNGPCPPPTAARMVRTVADAMRYAHDLGVVHRDLKPGNILLTPEHEPIVTDFGLAFRLDADDHIGQTVCGTPHYMAPEQWAGDAAAIGPRSDVYALGVILFQMLAGRVPFDGSPHEIMAKVQREAVPPVRKVRKDVPKGLARIVDRATARDPRDRFPDMAAFADALTDYLRKPLPKSGWTAGRVFLITSISAVSLSSVILLTCCVGALLPALNRRVTVQNPPPTPPLPATDDRAKRARAVWVEGEDYLNRSQFDEAVAKFDEAISLDPAAERPRALRAEAYTRVGRHADALAEYDTLLRWKPDNGDWMFRRAEAMIRLKKYADALPDLNRLIEMNTAHAPALIARGVARLGLNQPEQAKIDLTQAVFRAPGMAEPLFLRGVARRKLGEERGAAADFAAADKLDEQVERKLREKGYIE